MYELRTYQQQAADKGLEYFFNKKEKKPVLEVIPTAGGKSHVLAYIASKLDAPLLIFQPSIEILKQNFDKLTGTGVMGVTVYSASAGKKDIGNITLATIGSVWKNPQEFKEFKYIMVDECHLFSAKPSMYKSFFDAVGTKMIGFSATPWRQSTNSFGTEMRFLTRTNPRVFSKVIHVTQIKELVEQEYLAKTEYYSVKRLDRSKIKLNSTGGDYDEKSEREYYDKINYQQHIQEVVTRLLKAGKTRILIFTKYVKEAQEISKIMGSETCYVSGLMPQDERNHNITGFRSGAYKCCFNVGVTKLGFDYPQLEVMVDTAPVRSLTSYMQKVGRVLRTHPEKKVGWVVDMAGNKDVFGRVEDMEILQLGTKNEWAVVSNGKQLTNVYLSEIMKN